MKNIFNIFFGLYFFIEVFLNVNINIPTYVGLSVFLLMLVVGIYQIFINKRESYSFIYWILFPLLVSVTIIFNYFRY